MFKDKLWYRLRGTEREGERETAIEREGEGERGKEREREHVARY